MSSYLPNTGNAFPEPALFTPDFAYMDKMLQRRKALYDEGFAQINSKYNYINRETTNPYNTKVKDQFLKQARESLKDLSTMDLSQIQNVRAAGSVFSPFSKNLNVVGDQSLTEYWNREISKGESFRTQDGGKFFHQDNIDYIKQQKNYFAMDTPDTWGEYYSTKRGYTPYVDVKKAVADAMKDFKPSHVKTFEKNGAYITVVDDKSYTAAEIYKYLDAVLPEQVKNQMKIHGAVKYGNDFDLLKKAYVAGMSPVQQPLTDKIHDLEAEILAAKNDPEKQKKLIADRDAYVKRQNEIAGNIDGIATGDISFVRKNAENLAYQLYYQDEMTTLANGYAHKDIEYDLKFDDWAIAQWKNQEEWNRMYVRRGWELEDREYKERQEKKDKKEEGIFPLLPRADGTTMPESLTYESAGNQVRLQTNNVLKLQNELAEHVRVSLNLPAGQVITKKQFSAYVKQHPNDSHVYRWVEENTILTSMMRNYKNYGARLGEHIAKKMGAKNYGVYTVLNKKVESGQKLSQPEQLVYNSLKEAHTTYRNDFLSGNKVYVGTSYTSYGLNTGDKRFKEAAGAISSYIGGIDQSLIGGISFTPAGEYGTDLTFTLQKDPNKSTWEADAVEKSLKNSLPAGTKVEKVGDNQFTIRNVPQQLTLIDPYVGYSRNQKKILMQISFGQDGEWSFPARSFDNKNIQFRIRKNNGYYYLQNNAGLVIPEINAFSDIHELSSTLRSLLQNNKGDDINNSFVTPTRTPEYFNP